MNKCFQHLVICSMHTLLKLKMKAETKFRKKDIAIVASNDFAISLSSVTILKRNKLQS